LLLAGAFAYINNARLLWPIVVLLEFRLQLLIKPSVSLAFRNFSEPWMFHCLWLGLFAEATYSPTGGMRINRWEQW
jgi:hypothetical protein